MEADNYADLLSKLDRFKEAKSLLRKMLPVAQRVHGDSDEATLRMRWTYAQALYEDPAATLDDLREAVTTLEEMGSTMRRILGSAHPDVGAIGNSLLNARAAKRRGRGMRDAAAEESRNA